MRLYKYGDPTVVYRNYYNKDHLETCIIDGCEGKYVASGLCKKHHTSMLVKASGYANQKKYRKTLKGRAQSRAHSSVRYAIRMGKLVKQPCEACGSKQRIHAHHDSYLKNDYLRVRWLCDGCHQKWHKHNDPIYPTHLEQIRAFAAQVLNIQIPLPNEAI